MSGPEGITVEKATPSSPGESRDEPARALKILVANESEERLGLIAAAVAAVGHSVVASTVDLAGIGSLSRAEDADVALVGIGANSPHALDMISSIVQEAACPVIAVLDAPDESGLVAQAARRGVFAYVAIDGRPDELANALDITLERFTEFTNLQGAFGRRATIEQAKGILMARNGVDADAAYALLKRHSQRTGLRLIQVAAAVTQTYLLLPPVPEQLPGPPEPG
jgi:two-component system, response regulator / RNA-binding antiterminator